MTAWIGTEESMLKRIEADQSATISCPHCGLALLTMTQDTLHTVSGQAWLLDGDTVPGVDSAVDSSALGGGHMATLMVGACPRCRGAYWVAEATIANGSWEALEAFLAGSEPFDQDEGPIRTYVLADDGDAEFLDGLEPFRLTGLQGRNLSSSWWLIEHDTAIGPIHEHSFGPFPLHDLADLSGPSGVASCGTLAMAPPWRMARDRLLAAWPELVKIHTTAVENAPKFIYNQ